MLSSTCSRVRERSHLNVFCTSGHILWPGVIVSPLGLPSYRDLNRINRGTCRRVRKLYVNLYIYVVNPLQTDIHTYKHNLRLRPHKRLLHPHDYVPHAKVFSNYRLFWSKQFHFSWKDFNRLERLLSSTLVTSKINGVERLDGIYCKQQ